MRVIVCDNYDKMSETAANLIVSQIMLKPNSILGLATGSTPVGMYEKLGEKCKNGEVDFSKVSSFNLDEYYPIKKSNDQSYAYFMEENLFSKINIDRANTHIPNGETDDPDAECKAYEESIKKAGGVDLQILGIGRNGHIGFNEPEISLSSHTHLTKLTESTIEANSRFFDNIDEVPKKALTMGIATILSAKKIILLASGASKSRVISELMNDEINTDIPATMLKTHPDVILICDRDAYTGARFGVDIGGTNIKFAVVEGRNVKSTYEIDTADTAEGIIDDIVKQYKKIKKVYDIKGIGVGTPGVFKNGCVSAVNLPFKNLPLEKILAEKTGASVSVDNDANCAGLGEVSFGIANDCENIVLITLGTGVGGAVITGRKLLQSNNKMGEIGHIIIQADGGRQCPCGLCGCFEQYASATALSKDAAKAAEENKDSVLYEIYMQNGKKLGGKEVFKAIDKGCPVAKSVFEKYVHYLAVGIDSLNNIFGPDAVVLAGGITKQGSKLLEPLKKAVRTDVRIEISDLQSRAGSLGAAML